VAADQLGGCIVFERATIPLSATTNNRRGSLATTLFGKYDRT
jgi:hypothetical protein